ncbi:MAG TPA: hypothetical protein VHB46_16415 [Burkholderiales bacterium]|nr:hypothetical protein [Burkholderiales bacterium]
MKDNFIEPRMVKPRNRLLALAVTTALALAVGESAYATGRIFYDDFESGNTNLWGQDSPHGRCTVVTSSADGVAGPFAGSRMLRCNDDGASSAGYESLTISPSYIKELFIRTRIRIDTNHDRSTGSPKKLMRVFNWTGDFNTYNDIFESTETSNGLVNTGTAGGTQFSTYWGGAGGDNTARTTAWHKIEYYFNTTGTIRVWHDGVMVQNQSGLPTNNAKWVPFFITSNWADSHDGTNYVYFDEFEVFSDSVSGNITGTMFDGTIAVSTTTPPPPPISPPPNLRVF